jgi:hypothetical protein
MSSFRWAAGLAVTVMIGALGGACGGSSTGSSFKIGDGGHDATEPDGSLKLDGGKDDSGLHLGGNDGGGGHDAAESGPLTITPLNKTVQVTLGMAAPTIKYEAHMGGAIVPVSWSIDRGEIGSIVANSGVFTAGETVGGVANITATYTGGLAVSTPVTVVLSMVENGGTPMADAGADAAVEAGTGVGGSGGVGGNGSGGAVSSSTQTVLQSTPMADSTIGWLYPYNNTVWPQGILAPLLQWNAGSYNFDAVYIHISENTFDYKGYFAKTATPYVNEPVSQAAWKAMGYSNAGESVTVSLVFASGGMAIGPITETWKIALGTLEGTVYYNSYGTNLAHNYCCTVDGAMFGGATLAIKGGSTDPVLIAGSDSECRVCHSVASGGSTLITQNGSSTSDDDSREYNLQTLAETDMMPQTGIFGWPALSPDGTFLFSNSAPTTGSPSILGASSAASNLYSVPAGTAIANTGLPANLGGACPSFSPDGTHLAFNLWAGTGADQKSLAWLDFTPTTNTFGALTTMYTPPSGTVVWPSFFPTNDAVVFELETVNNGRDFGGTRSTCDQSGTCSNTGTEGELWWIDQKTNTATRLDQANGLGYLPKGPNGHGLSTSDASPPGDDSEYNYEPTMNPVPSGGYAWVVFTSRRMYGNVATINPYWSDPRYHDISQTPTTKKLWVAAIDLNAAPGTDPSHPAFYLPAQELLAGNSRGYWVVNPCLTDGSTCETGDMCCGGYCREGDAGGLVCGSMGPGCAQEYEKCTKTSDCCGASSGVECINDICSVSSPPPPPPPPK